MSHPNWDCDVDCACKTCGGKGFGYSKSPEAHCGCICKFLKCECCDWTERT